MIISSIAETNRAPMDLPEAESELVSGFMTEHSSLAFACFFLGEYSSIILMCIVISDIFLGGSIVGIGIIIYIFIWVRSSVPRLRYDQLMSIMWKGILPLLLGCITIEMCILTSLA